MPTCPSSKMKMQKKYYVMSAKAGLRKRVGFLDEIRGLCILLMVLYHGAYDIIYLFGWDIPLFHWPLVQLAQPFVAGIFIFISGICCRFSRSNLRRGLIALALGLLVGGVTLLFLPQQPIYFGILHFLGTAMILFALLQKMLDRLAPLPGLLLCLLLYLFSFGAQNGYLGLPGLPLLQLPTSWASHLWLIPLGFASGGVDYFPLLPWLFVFLAGSYLGVPFARGEMPGFFYRNRSRFLAATGRHTIYIYLLHQPVLYGLLYGFFYLYGKAVGGA